MFGTDTVRTSINAEVENALAEFDDRLVKVESSGGGGGTGGGSSSGTSASYPIVREENDEAFFAYERNNLRKQSCYHVYFEKAPEFEDYLFGTGYVGFETEEKKEQSETGKYGIAINSSKQEHNNVNTFKTIKFGKTASVATIVALAGIVYYMGSKGQLSNLSDKMKGMVGGIVDEKETPAGNIISVNGNVQRTTELESDDLEQQTQELASVSASEKKTTNSNKVSEEQTTVSEAVTSEVPTKEIGSEEITTENQATVSIPNENYQLYIVKAGDTLYSITLAKYGSVEKLDEIIALNKLEDEDYVIEGQKIFLP